MLAAGAVATFVASALLIYLAVGSPPSLVGHGVAATSPQDNRQSTAGGKAPSMEAATASLEARLAREGGSSSDWQLLAQSYEFLGRSEDAQRARARASEAALGSMSAVTAASILSTPRVADTPTVTDTPTVAGAQTVAGLPPRKTGGDAVAANVPVVVSGTVSLDNALSARVNGSATLFIYAKAVDSPGPPLAVMRTSAAGWPVSFHLDDSMAMLPSRRLSQFQKVVVEARRSRTGQAAPAPDDLYVISEVLRPGDGTKLALIISREIG